MAWPMPVGWLVAPQHMLSDGNEAVQQYKLVDDQWPP